MDKLSKKTERILVRMDKNLLKQLSRYSVSEDIPRAQAARKAIKQFLEEQEAVDKQ